MAVKLIAVEPISDLPAVNVMVGSIVELDSLPGGGAGCDPGRWEIAAPAAGWPIAKRPIEEVANTVGQRRGMFSTWKGA